MTEPIAAPTPPQWEDLARYIAGEGSPTQRAAIDAWLRSSPADAALVDELRRTTLGIPTVDVPGLDVERALSRTRSRMAAPVVSLDSHRRSPRGWRPVWVGAAAAAGLALAVGVAREFLTEPQATHVAASAVHRGRVGQVDSVALADGSLAILAPGSELTVPGGFGEGERRLRLVGRAWFRAAHDESKPFLVESEGVSVRDIGTEFSVEPLTGAGVRVAVHEGAVAVRGSSQSTETTLRQGDEATVTASGVSVGQIPKGDADWVSGELHFRDVTLEEFGAAMARWTGWVVRIDPAIGSMRVRTDISLTRAREQFEEAALSIGGAATWDGDTVTVSRVSKGG